jgi:hypothetical protein
MRKSNLWRALTLAALLPLSVGACGILDVTDPTVVKESDISNSTGAELMRQEAVTLLFNAASYGAWYSGLIADEFMAFPSKNTLSTGSAWGPHLIDLRQTRTFDGNRLSSAAYDAWQSSRMAATHALNWYLRYGSAAQRPHLGQLRAVRGYTMVGLAEQVCGGFALHELDWDKPVFGPPLTTDEVFARALVELDSAVVATADSARFLNFAKVTRGRALLGLGKFAEAAAAVQGVPTNFAFNGEFGGTAGRTNRLRMTFSSTGNNQGVANREGGNGIDFVSAADPRLALTLLGTAHDGVTRLYAATRYQATDSPLAIANGIEARLIEAEAALKGAVPGDWLATLNALRTDGTFTTRPNAQDPTKTDTLWRAGTGGVAGLRPLEDPGTAEARVDLLFRERAFWLFGTGHRLGDLRRLVRHYGRDAESVFPTGDYHLNNGKYDAATSLGFAITGEEQANTGVIGCTD